MSRSAPGSRRLWSVLIALGAIVSLTAGPAHAQNDTLRQAAEELGSASRASVGPLPQGEIKVLQAVVMSVTGRADWRPDSRSRWKRAAVDDLLDPGAEIRTGRRAKMVLRVGMNASILVDRHSRVVLPQIVQVGDTLRTAAQVTSGRADFKVDRVGLTNDFSVVTPSTTLAVRGTGFAVQSGAFNGTEVASSRLNEIYAIEITYFLTRFSFLLSAGSASGEKHPNPAINALFQTYGPPPLISAVVEDENTPELLDAALSASPIFSESQLGNSISTTMGIMDEEIFETPPPPPPPPVMDPVFDLTGFGATGAAGIAEFVCINLFDIFLNYDQRMIDSFGSAAPSGGFSFEGLNDLFFEINEFVCQGREQFFDEDLNTILSQVVVYCSNQFQTQEHVELCIQNFIDAGVEEFVQQPPP